MLSGSWIDAGIYNFRLDWEYEYNGLAIIIGNALIFFIIIIDLKIDIKALTTILIDFSDY